MDRSLLQKEIDQYFNGKKLSFFWRLIGGSPQVRLLTEYMKRFPNEQSLRYFDFMNWLNICHKGDQDNYFSTDYFNSSAASVSIFINWRTTDTLARQKSLAEAEQQQSSYATTTTKLVTPPPVQVTTTPTPPPSIEVTTTPAAPESNYTTEATPVVVEEQAPPVIINESPVEVIESGPMMGGYPYAGMGAGFGLGLVEGELLGARGHEHHHEQRPCPVAEIHHPEHPNHLPAVAVEHQHRPEVAIQHEHHAEYHAPAVHIDHASHMAAPHMAMGMGHHR